MSPARLDRPGIAHDLLPGVAGQTGEETRGEQHQHEASQPAAATKVIRAKRTDCGQVDSHGDHPEPDGPDDVVGGTESQSSCERSQ